MWKDPLAFLVENSLHLEVLFDVQNCLLRIFNTNIRVMRHKESNSSFRDPDDKGISSTWAGEIMQGRTDVNTLVLLQQQRLILCYYESTHLYNHIFFAFELWVEFQAVQRSQNKGYVVFLWNISLYTQTTVKSL